MNFNGTRKRINVGRRVKPSAGGGDGGTSVKLNVHLISRDLDGLGEGATARFEGLGALTISIQDLHVVDGA